MKFLKIKLLIMAAIMFAASSAFASLSYNVNVNTSGLATTDGYLYLQYIPTGGAVASTATVSNFVTDGSLGSQSLVVTDGSAVTGTLPGSVVFANTDGINDYNHAIHFGNSISFNLLLDSPSFSTASVDSSTFSLGLFGDEAGTSPLLNTSDPSTPGTLFTVSLYNDGTGTAQVIAPQAKVTPTPIPAAAWLLGSGIMGLVGIRRKRQI